ncbi:MAG: hypothetical protein K2I17_00890 [Clostridia bacterium]|nr:hypothetical protein [Clostridia bacterium]
MVSIIKELFFGERGQHENIITGKRYKKLCEELFEVCKELSKDFNEKQKELFEMICNMQAEIEGEAVFQNYREGFKIGLLLALECLDTP